MGKRKAPTQKSKPSDDNSNNSSKAEKTLASATEKNPVKASDSYQKMAKRKAPTQKPKPSDDSSNNSSKAENTLASATEKTL